MHLGKSSHGHSLQMVQVNPPQAHRVQAPPADLRIRYRLAETDTWARSLTKVERSARPIGECVESAPHGLDQRFARSLRNLLLRIL
jgi:hypothetical protein